MSGALQAVLMNLRSFGIGGPYWLGLLIGTSPDNSQGAGIALDSAANVYVVGQNTPPATGVDFVLAKYNNSGTIQWQRRLSSNGGDYGYDIAVDTSGNVYVAGRGTNSTYCIIAKYDTSGTLQWQRSLGFSTNQSIGFSIAVDSSGNVYVTGEYITTNETLLITKYDTSGTIQWQRTLGRSGSTSVGQGVAVDSSGNVYVAGYQEYSGQGGPEFLLVKYDTSGVIQFQKILGTASNEIAYSIALDASNNIYVTGQIGGAADLAIGTVKYDSSGNVQWQRRLDPGTSVQAAGYGVSVDSSGNVYVTGKDDNAGTLLVIAKYNSSGTIQWQRTLTSTFSPTNIGYSIINDTSGNVYLTGLTAPSSNEILIAKLPNDGSLTGAYTVGPTTITYGTGSLTANTSSMIAGTGALTDASSSLTSATSTLTSSTSSLTSSVTTI